MSKVTLLGMKVDSEVADNVLKLYEEQKDKEDGTPYKGEFVGGLFENAINAFIRTGTEKTAAQTPQPPTSPKPGFNYKLATGVLLVLVIILAAILWFKLKSEKEDEA